MANNRIYLTCAECGEQLLLGKSFLDGAYYPEIYEDSLENRLNAFYDEHTHLIDDCCNLLGTNLYIEHEAFSNELNNWIRNLYRWNESGESDD